MRLSLPSIAIISLFAASSHAFAPPQFTAAPIIPSSRLAAKPPPPVNELSGMLSDYSSSASAVATTPPTPPPVEVAESAVTSVAKAASAAQDAADQAAAAAAAVAAKSAAAAKVAAVTKTATVAAGASVVSNVSPLKSLTAAGAAFVPATPDATKMPFQVDPSKITYSEPFDASLRAKQNLAIMQSNLGWGQAKESTRVVKERVVDTSSPTPHFDFPKIDFDSAAPTVAAIVASLHLKEYGGWYAAAALALIASQQRSAGMEDATLKYETELAAARDMASEAASAAGMAAEGAKLAKNLAMKMDKDSKMDGGKALLESSKSKILLVEKDIIERELLATQMQVTSLRNELDKAEGKKKKRVKTRKASKTEIEEEYPNKVLIQDEGDIDERIVEMLKLMDAENAITQKKAGEELEKKREEEAKFVAAEKLKAESKKMTKGAETAQANTEVAIKGNAASEKAKKSNTTAKRKTATKKSVSKKAPVAATPLVKKAPVRAKPAEKKAPVVAKPAAKKAPVAEKPVAKKAPVVAKPAAKKAPVAEKLVAKKAPVVAKPDEKKATKATEPATKKAPRRAASTKVDDWATLADSTLKRKTVAQLTGYLTEKGVMVTSSDGKALKKADLLSAVKSL